MFFRSSHSAVEYSAVQCKQVWALQKQLDHKNLRTIFEIFIWSEHVFLFEGLYFALWCCRCRSGFFLPIQGQFFCTFNMTYCFTLYCDTLMTVTNWCAFFNTHGGLLCVYTALVIHFPTMKHQHEAISQCNRFVSSQSRSPGGPIMGPCGPWRWFREKGGGKKQGVTGNC